MTDDEVNILEILQAGALSFVDDMTDFVCWPVKLWYFYLHQFMWTFEH